MKIAVLGSGGREHAIAWKLIQSPDCSDVFVLPGNDGIALTDGVHIEVHDCPEKAFSDGPQALLPDQFHETFQQLEKVAKVFGKTFS